MFPQKQIGSSNKMKTIKINWNKVKTGKKQKVEQNKNQNKKKLEQILYCVNFNFFKSIVMEHNGN